jgi:hypothetical protein
MFVVYRFRVELITANNLVFPIFSLNDITGSRDLRAGDTIHLFFS